MGGRPLDIGEIKKLLAVKADRWDIGILDKTKADKIETRNFESLVHLVTTQIEHLLALSIENMKIDLNSPHDSEHSNINKKASLLTQMISLYSWSK